LGMAIAKGLNVDVDKMMTALKATQVTTGAPQSA
jgi:hypothetical protein